MHEPEVKAWEAFYVVVGTSAGALTGLQFVVLTLISESGVVRGSRQTFAVPRKPWSRHGVAEPGRLEEEVAPLGVAGGSLGGEAKAGDRARVVPGALEQMRAHGVQPVVARDPRVGAQLVEARESRRRPILTAAVAFLLLCAAVLSMGWIGVQLHELRANTTFTVADTKCNVCGRVERVRELERSSPAALLAGSSDIEKDYVLSALGSRDGLDWLEAVPRNQDTAFEQIRLGFGKAGLEAMELRDQFGQITVIRFSTVERNIKLPGESFRFSPPKGADVISE